MIPVIDSPESIQSAEPILRIDMRQMDAEDIQTMLEQSRDGFYSNKELAPIREYSTNARDSHIRKGIGSTPIQVTLPTTMEPELKIRDFGIGLSYETISDIYFKYWKSTKRLTNDENGCLGIGSKSAFGYTAIYTVTSWCEGMKTIITGQKSGFADVIYRGVNTDNEPEGVEVVIPILQKDITKFTSEAMNFFKHWDIRPIFKNIDEEALKIHFATMDSTPFLAGDGWAIRPSKYGSSESVAVMGFVPYTIDWYQVKNSLSPEVNVKIGGIFDFLKENITTLSFPNGTLAFTPNRETLQYNEVTVTAISNRLVSIYDTLLNMITSKISSASNIWDAKIIYNRIFRKELDGFDKEMFYGGNLDSIERLLRTRIQWNGINIANGLFSDLHYWDKFDGNRGPCRGMSYLFQIYVKNEKSDDIKLLRCHRKRNNKMIASPKSVVLIQDTDKPRLIKAAARHYLIDSGKDISQVYVLILNDPKVKDEFIKHFNFDSVPAINLSAMEPSLKSYFTRKTYGGSGGATRGTYTAQPLYIPHIDITDNRDSSGQIDDYNINTSELTNARDVLNGVYIIADKATKGRYNAKLHIAGDVHQLSNAEHIIQSIYDLSVATDTPIKRVYCIRNSTTETTWFKKAVKQGKWTHLNDWAKAAINKIDDDNLKKVATYATAFTNKRVGVLAMKQLVDGIVDIDSKIVKHFNEIINLSKYMKSYYGGLYLTKKFDSDTFVDSNLKQTINDVYKTYPLIFKLNNSTALENCNEHKNAAKFKDAEIIDIVDYINMMNSKLDNQTKLI